MMKMQSRKIWYYRITLIILLFAVLLAWALLPGVHEFINRSVAAFAAVDQFDGRRGTVLFYRQSDGPRSGGKINRQNRT